MKNHIKTFEGMFSATKFLVVYQVTNYRASFNNETTPDTIRAENKSMVYSYLLPATDEDDARNKFSIQWQREAMGNKPTPKLEIISITNVTMPDTIIHIQ